MQQSATLSSNFLRTSASESFGRVIFSASSSVIVTLWLKQRSNASENCQKKPKEGSNRLSMNENLEGLVSSSWAWILDFLREEGWLIELWKLQPFEENGKHLWHFPHKIDFFFHKTSSHTRKEIAELTPLDIYTVRSLQMKADALRLLKCLKKLGVTWVQNEDSLLIPFITNLPSFTSKSSLIIFFLRRKMQF